MKKIELGTLVLVCGGMACGDVLVDGDTSVELRIEEVSTSQIPTRGGVEIIVVGKNFARDVSVTIDGHPVLSLATQSDSLITFVAPTLPIGPKRLIVANPNGQVAQTSLRYYSEVVDFINNIEIGSELGRSYYAPFYVGDLTGDGFDDVLIDAAMNSSDGTAGVVETIFTSSGGGDFTRWAEVSWQPASVTFRSERLLTDINGDGLADEVWQKGSYRLSSPQGLGPLVKLGDGPADFLLLGDYDGDGGKEIFKVDFFGKEGLIYRIHADGQVTSRAIKLEDSRWNWFPGGSPGNPVSNAVGDFNRDGKDDLALVGYDEKIHFLLGPDLEDSWQIGLPFDLTDAHEESSIQDFDDDGYEDLLLVARGQGYLFHSDVTGLVPVPEVIALCPGVEQGSMVATTDRQWNRDKGHDPLIKMDCGDQVWTWINGQLVQAEPSRGEVFADLNGDAFIDMLAYDVAADGYSHVALLGADSTHFLRLPWFDVADPQLPRDSQTQQVATPRIDGKEQLVLVSGHLLSRWQNGDVGRFAPTLALPASAGQVAQAMHACDQNRDGQDELIIWMTNPPQWDTIQMLVLSWNGLGWTVSSSDEFPRPNGHFTFPAIATPGSCEAVWLEWNSTTVRYQRGVFWRATQAGSEITTRELSDFSMQQASLLDVNRDGKTDLVGGNQIFVNQGNYEFTVSGQIKGDLHGWWSLLSDDNLLAALFSDGTVIGQATLDSTLTWQTRNFVEFPHQAVTPQMTDDMNGDGLPDIVLLGPNHSLLVAPVDAAGNFYARPIASSLSDPRAQEKWIWTKIFDADADGLDDIFYVDAKVPTKVSLLRNRSR